ncbi:MAG: GNAT family N-acetyltransferase [Roseibium sp.]|nr:GNAT family N-acetyltransferase [Roseibium sp.]
MAHDCAPLSPRLRFRKPAAGDAAFLLALMNDSAYLRFIGDRKVRDLNQARAYIENKLLPPFSDSGFGLWVTELSASADPIGLCGLVKRDTLPGPDLGYAFLPAYRRKGYAREAAEAVLYHAAHIIGLQNVLAIVDPENAPSRDLLNHLGFVFQDKTVFPPSGDTVDMYSWTGAEPKPTGTDCA